MAFNILKCMDDPSNRSQKPPRQAVIYPDPNALSLWLLPSPSRILARPVL